MSKALKVLVIHQEPNKRDALETFVSAGHGWQIQYIHCPEDLKHYKNNFTNDNFDGFLVQSNGNDLGKDIFKLVERENATNATKKIPFFIALSTGSENELATTRRQWLLEFADVVVEKQNEDELLEQIITLARARSNTFQVKSNKPKGLIKRNNKNKESKGSLFLFNDRDLNKDSQQARKARKDKWVSFKKSDQGTTVLNYLLDKPGEALKEGALRERVYISHEKIMKDKYEPVDTIKQIRAGIVEILMDDSWFKSKSEGKQLAKEFSEKIISEGRDGEYTYKYDNYITIEGFKEDES